MGLSVFPVPSATAPTKSLGLSILSTNSTITTLPTGREITAVVIGGGGGAGMSGSAGGAGGGGTGGAGSGQMREYTFTLTSAITASVTIGAGGAGVSSQNALGNNGGNTVLTIPGFAVVTAPGGTGSSIPPGPGGGSGGGNGGGGSGSGGPGGAGGIFGTPGSITPIFTTYASDVIAPYQDPVAASEISTVFYHSVTNGSTTAPLVGRNILNILPGTPVQIRSANTNTIGWDRGNGGLNLTSSYTGDTASGMNNFIPAVINNPYSVIKDAVKLLTAANITLPGGGGGGAGARSDSTTPARVGGLGAGTGGNGGSGAVTGQPGSVLATATSGNSGAQPGGGAGGTGAFGWNGNGGPGGSASGGAGAVYFFWVA